MLSYYLSFSRNVVAASFDSNTCTPFKIFIPKSFNPFETKSSSYFSYFVPDAYISGEALLPLKNPRENHEIILSRPYETEARIRGDVL